MERFDDDNNEHGNKAGEPNLLGLVLPASGLGVVLFIAIAVVLLLAEQITVRLILSLCFVAVPYLALSAGILLSVLDRKERLMQNGLLITLSIIYLLVAIALTVVLNLLHLSLRPFIALELVVLAVGIITIIAGISAKRHMDKH